jgi:predicted small lipoprotein YifL
MSAMTTSKMVLLVAMGLVLAGLGTCGTLYLPRTEKVNITGVEVKFGQGAQPQDTRYLLTQTVSDKETAVFRNEDTRFGWPPYFKFNAVDLSGEAARIEKNEPNAVVLVTYYGLKSNVLGLQPNVVSMRVVDAGYEHFPLFNIVVSALAVLLVLFGTFKTWRWLSKREQAKATSAT